MEEKIVLTKEKIGQLKVELKKLEGEKKKDLSQSLEQARLRDVSEDTDEVVVVMRELEEVDNRISEIRNILANSKVLKKGSIASGKIAVGSEVKVRSHGKTSSFSIVSEIESDPSNGKISDRSPLGKALLKAKVGDIVKLSVNDLKIEYEVLEII